MFARNLGTILIGRGEELEIRIRLNNSEQRQLVPNPDDHKNKIVQGGDFFASAKEWRCKKLVSLDVEPADIALELTRGLDEFFGDKATGDDFRRKQQKVLGVRN